MDSEIALLKKALERQKKARFQAERILEEKSKELYDVTRHLRETNGRLENLLNDKTSELEGVFANIIDPYVVMDLKFNVINMNISAKEFLGYDNSKEVINLTQLVHKDFAQYTAESMKSLLEVGLLKNYRAKIIIKDGSEKWVQINSSLIYNKEGKPIGAQGIVRDVTNEMEVKELLSEQRKQLDIIINNSPLGIMLTKNGKILKANRTMANLLGHNIEDLTSLTIKDITVPEYYEESEQLMQKMNNGKLNKFSLVKKYLKKDGSKVNIKVSVSAVNNDHGKTEYHVAMVEDITKQLQAEERLRSEREKYSRIIANMNLGLIEADLNGNILLVNQSFCNMSGYQEHELIGKKATDFLRLKDKNIVKEKLALKEKGKLNSFEIEVFDKTGAKKHWLLSGAPIYDIHNKVSGSIGIHLDITNQKKLELQKEHLVKELENSNKGLQEYAHIVSHDLKSPLRSISALATWMQEDYKDVLDEGGQHNLQLMQEKIASMDKLIHGILEYSTANSSELDSKKVDLNEVVAEVGETIYIPNNVTLSIPEKLPVLQADRTKLRQLFQNIIGNAVVHIEKEKGLVEVLCKETTTHYIFNIKDNGVGIPKEYHKKIFEIFQSIGNKERSTGIGLSIVKKIVDRYGGEVWVDSIVGEGTEFQFTLNKEICSFK
ncbi:PAS domain-containing sensor histidine kinase [Maribacter sp. CXY002]|uniref:PAS domain-containing sensor histidine kinase n=1 Tax=Maribacter luteocoastalis TaxID=3407671 RepID=UPI003B66D735